MSRKRCFEPVADQHTRLLILGTLPGEISLRTREYYGNPQNAFWKLMARVLHLDLLQLDYPDRIAELARSGVGLWDVVSDALRSGSLDADIRGPQTNDLLEFLVAHPSIKAVAFNGRTAAKFGLRQLSERRERFRIFELPSSSPAHAVPFDRKLESWMELRDCLLEESRTLRALAKGL